MRKAILAAVCATVIGGLSAGTASAQTTAPSGQDSTKTGTTTSMSNDNAGKTQGMSKTSVHKSAAHKAVKKDKMMNNDSMSK